MKIAFVRIMNKIPAKTALACGVSTTGVNLIHTETIDHVMCDFRIMVKKTSNQQSAKQGF